MIYYECPKRVISENVSICEDRMDALNVVVDYYMILVDLINIVAFSRFIYVLASKKACGSVEYTVRVQVLNCTIAHNLVYVVGVLLNHSYLDSIVTKYYFNFNEYKKHLMVMQFTSARMFNAVFGFLMALTRFTAVKSPLRQQEIWTKWKLGIAIACVWLLTGAMVVFTMYFFSKLMMWMPIDFICPLFVLSSVIIYVVIIVMVKKTLMLDFRNKSFYRCLSRITIAAFAICIGDLILPSMYFFFNYVVVLSNAKYNQTSSILGLVSYNFAFFVTNSLTVWVFILFVPRFRFLFFGSFCQQSPSNRASLSTERQRV